MDVWSLSDLSTPWCVHVVATLRIADHIAAGVTGFEDLRRHRVLMRSRCIES